MMGWADLGLSTAQAAFVEERLPGARVVQDLSWGLFDNHVAEVRAGRDVFVAERSDDHEARETAKSLRALDAEHRIDPASVAEARSVLERSEPRPVVLVPTHGDWQPRNWLIDHGVVRVIDFGRFGFRPASSDLIRVDSKQWPERPDLAAAFFDGYGPDPREPDLWPVVRLREAIGTAVWAYEVGDDRFEEHGLRMLAAALRAFR